jgi:hypothetical protein
MQDRRSSHGDVRIFDDHRDNLTVDVHSDLVLEHAAQMRSEHSEAALLWNVFRALQRIDAAVWLPRLVTHAIKGLELEAEAAASLRSRSNLAEAVFHWWRRWDVPESRQLWLREAAANACLHLEHYAPRSIPEKKSEVQRRLQADLPFEDALEIPLCIETPEWVLAVEAVYKGNLRRHIAYDALRDHVLRLLDAGSHGAAALGKRLFTLVVCTDTRVLNVETARLVERYRGKPARLAEALPHRGDVEVLRQAAHGLGLLRWKDLGSLLIEAKDEERLGAFDAAALDELIKYLGRKDIGFNFFRRVK